MNEQEKRIYEIRIRRSRITGTNWRYESRGWSDKSCALYLGETDFNGFDHHKEENAEFIAHAPEDIDFLLSEIKRFIK